MSNEMKKEVALIIVFNHRYDKNIDILDRMYENRFSNIYYIVPFYNGSKKNVIPVYESSYYFQGYFVQGFHQYFKDEYAHFIFLADDMVLNPNINENNYQTFFQLSAESSFISEFYGLDNINDNYLYCSPATIKDGIAKLKGKKVKKWWWCRVIDGYKYSYTGNGIEVSSELPDNTKATHLLERHNVFTKQLSYIDIFGGPQIPFTFRTLWPNMKYFIYHEILHVKYNLKYPLAGAYSDIVIVSHESIKDFIRYCGIFSATKLFVELAVPTALLFASNNVVTEKNTEKKGRVFWPQTQKRKEIYEREMEKYNNKIDRLLNDFPTDWLYLHPVKLSKWT